MTTEQIGKFLSSNTYKGLPIKIDFGDRRPVTGIFIDTADFEELKSKNFWRIVSEANFDEWKESRDFSLCRIFNGISFKKLSIA